MDVPGGIFVQRHRFKKNVVVFCLRRHFLGQIDDLVDYCSNFKRVGVHSFAYFALELLPVERSDIWVLRRIFFCFLSQNPTFKALEVNQPH